MRKIKAIDGKGNETVFESIDSAVGKGFIRSSIEKCLTGNRTTHRKMIWCYEGQLGKVISNQFNGKIKLSMYRVDEEYILDGKIKVFFDIKEGGAISAALSLNSSVPLGEGEVFQEHAEGVEASKWSAYITLSKLDERFIGNSGDMVVFLGFRFYEDHPATLKINQIIPRDHLEDGMDTNIGWGSSRNEKVSRFKDLIVQSKQ